MSGYEQMLLLFVILPMIVLGVLGWFIGKKLENRYCRFRWLRWAGLLFGVILACFGGTGLSFLVAPCGFFGC